MNRDTLTNLLKEVSENKISVQEAYKHIKNTNIEDIEYAQIDHHRSIRKGFPEVIFGMNKSADQILGIIEIMIKQENTILITRTNSDKARLILQKYPKAEYDEESQMLAIAKTEIEITGNGEILIITAGTSDIPVAREAYLTAKYMGNHTTTIFDVGVAGIHRLFKHHNKLSNASVLIVAAGMEGALPSVIAGLVNSPVIAVPTSIGYGTSFNGLTALFSMLNCCSSNVAVVNIDNGFGAGYMASTINHIKTGS